jgi:hypothetical protein
MAPLKSSSEYLGEIGKIEEQSCNVATRVRKTGDETATYRVCFQVQSDDRNCAGSLPKRLHHHRADREDRASLALG